LSEKEKEYNQTLSKGFKALLVTSYENNKEAGLPFPEKRYDKKGPL